MTDQIVARPTFMKIVHDYPPNYAAIRAVFPAARTPGVIFTFGSSIYNPSGRPLSNALIAHEEVHAHRQRMHLGDTRLFTPEAANAWWDRYLKDPEFRWVEESMAHIAEYRAVLEGENNRANRRAMLTVIAKRLSGPLYGRMVSYDECKRMLKKAGQEEFV